MKSETIFTEHFNQHKLYNKINLKLKQISLYIKDVEYNVYYILNSSSNEIDCIAGIYSNKFKKIIPRLEYHINHTFEIYDFDDFALNDLEIIVLIHEQNIKNLKDNQNYMYKKDNYNYIFNKKNGAIHKRIESKYNSIRYFIGNEFIFLQTQLFQINLDKKVLSLSFEYQPDIVLSYNSSLKSFKDELINGTYLNNEYLESVEHILISLIDDYLIVKKSI